MRIDDDYLYEERAAIKEFDGKMPREQAEREARLEFPENKSAGVTHGTDGTQSR